MLIEAGCREKVWYSEDDDTKSFYWSSHGTLLEEGACIGNDYRKYFVPEKGKTKVYTTIDYQKVRDIKSRHHTMFVDLSLTMRWIDPNIRSNLSDKHVKNGEVILSPEAVAMIWTPDLYVWNRTEFKKEHISLWKSKILFDHKLKEVIDPKGKTVVEQKYEIKAIVFCKFQFSLYPMDEQTCKVALGSSSYEAIFTLYDNDQQYHSTTHYEADGRIVTITYFDQGFLENGNNTIGIEVLMTWKKQGMMMRYYIPCIMIVIVSEIGFVIPIPGRAGLLVTQFLTLVNLLIYQSVYSISYDNFQFKLHYS